MWGWGASLGSVSRLSQGGCSSPSPCAREVTSPCWIPSSSCMGSAWAASSSYLRWWARSSGRPPSCLPSVSSPRRVQQDDLCCAGRLKIQFCLFDSQPQEQLSASSWTSTLRCRWWFQRSSPSFTLWSEDFTLWPTLTWCSSSVYLLDWWVHIEQESHMAAQILYSRVNLCMHPCITPLMMQGQEQRCSLTLGCVFSTHLLFSPSGFLQWISVPFALGNRAVSDIAVTAVKQVYQSPWRGNVNRADTWVWIDNFCLLVSLTMTQHWYWRGSFVLVHTGHEMLSLRNLGYTSCSSHLTNHDVNGLDLFGCLKFNHNNFFKRTIDFSNKKNHKSMIFLSRPSHRSVKDPSRQCWEVSPSSN